jgi:apolipoprotein N-acyltransferase
MDRIANLIIVQWGWRRFLIAFAAGGLSALAFAPFDLFPVLWISLPVFVFLIDGSTPAGGGGPLRALVPAAAVGWWFGFGFFVAGLWWIGAAFLVDAEQFAWLMPVAVVILPAGLALFFALGAALARALWTDGWSRLLAFAIAMASAEWLRGHVLTGFPWNAFGYALAPTPLMMQSASLVGLWGLTLAAFIIFAAPAAFAGAGRQTRGRNIYVALVGLLLAAHLAFGWVRLAAAGDATIPGVRIRIVQPVIEQSEKWQTENEEAIVRKYLDLSDGATSPERTGVSSATILIWPESAFPFLLTERPAVLAAIDALLPEGTILITGAARGEPPGGRDNPPRVFNSIYVIDAGGEIIDAYDKVHLVPFGEFLPFRSLFEAIGIRQLVALPGGFSPGSRRRTVPLSAAPAFAPLICYEAIFPGEVVEPGSKPGWLLNLTNDAWYGATPGPYQHFAAARLRAVEEGLPLVRGANSGISAIVDPYGRVMRSLGLNVTGILDGDLPAPVNGTIQARFGDLAFLALLVLCAGTLVAARSRSLRSSRN